MSAREYRFKRLKDRILMTGSAVAALAVTGAATLSMGPLFFLAACALGATEIWAQRRALGMPTETLIAQDIKDKGLEEVPETALVHRMTVEICQRLGREMPKIYITPEGGENAFTALYGRNMIVLSKAAFIKHHDEDLLRFTLAHEISHLEADDFLWRLDVNEISQVMIKYGAVAGMLLTAMFIVTGMPLALFGITSGAAAVGVFAVLYAAQYITPILYKYSSRENERCTDRGALYITRDLEGAKSAMNILHDREDRQPCSFFQEVQRTHPTYIPRMKALEKSFNDVAKYPPLPPAKDAVAPVPFIQL